MIFGPWHIINAYALFVYFVRCVNLWKTGKFISKRVKFSLEIGILLKVYSKTNGMRNINTISQTISLCFNTGVIFFNVKSDTTVCLYRLYMARISPFGLDTHTLRAHTATNPGDVDPGYWRASYPSNSIRSGGNLHVW